MSLWGGCEILSSPNKPRLDSSVDTKTPGCVDRRKEKQKTFRHFPVLSWEGLFLLRMYDSKKDTKRLPDPIGVNSNPSSRDY